MTASPGVLLVGSVPLSNEREVFKVMSEHLGDRVHRVPDGETGGRSTWLAWQRGVFEKVPQLEPSPGVPGQYPEGLMRFRLRPDADPASVVFDNLGYADAALASYETFSSMQAAGELPAGWKFQVSLPTPLAGVSAWSPHDVPALEPAYERGMIGEIERIAAVIPADRLAIQWDVCLEVWQWEGWQPAHHDDVQGGIIERLARLSTAVPAGVELGYHICYGDFGHQHLSEPQDLGVSVDIANGIAANVDRTVEWVHMPVPIERTDDAYFAPLGKLALHPETELYLGLIHIRDGDDGAQKRVAAARAAGIDSFGVAAECGMGRRPPDRGGSEDGFQELLDLHARVADSMS